MTRRRIHALTVATEGQRLLVERSETLTELADLVGVPVQRIDEWRGGRVRPSGESARKLRDALGIGLTNDEIEALIDTAVAEYLAQVPIGGEVLPSISGGYVYRSAIQAAITGTIERRYLIRCNLTVPAADVPIAANEAPLAGAIVATNIHQVSSLGVI